MRLLVHGEIEGEKVFLGTIETVSGKGEQFAYDRSFAERYPRAQMSVALPFQKDPLPARATRAFFRNMLPEGDALAAVSKELEVRSSSYLKILDALGSECVGAITIEGEGGVSTGSEVPAYAPISRSDLTAYARGEGVCLADLQIGSKLSIAGAQSKTGLAVSRDEKGSVSYFVPCAGAPSTHIVKIARRAFESLSENEYCCLSVARACGLRVPPLFVDMLDEDTPLFVIQRYDRVADHEGGSDVPFGSVRRLHQEDFCQALGKQPEKKYEREGWGYAKLVHDVLYAHSDDPIADSKDFVKLLAFNSVVGNCDGHLKNVSLLRSDDWARSRLAPVYDVASTVVYSNLDRRMGMRIGSARKIDEVCRDDFMQMAKELGVSQRSVGNSLDEVLEGTRDSMEAVIRDVEETCGGPLPKLRDIGSFACGQIKKLAVDLQS